MTDDEHSEHPRLTQAPDVPVSRVQPTSEGPGLDPVAAAAPAYAQLARIVLGGQPLGQVLGRVAELAAELIPGAEEVSVTLMQRGRARSVAFSGQRAALLDERQYQDG